MVKVVGAEIWKCPYYTAYEGYKITIKNKSYYKHHFLDTSCLIFSILFNGHISKMG